MILVWREGLQLGMKAKSLGCLNRFSLEWRWLHRSLPSRSKDILLHTVYDAEVVTDSICLPSASKIRNTLFLFKISSFICWCISKRKRKREAVLTNF